MRIICPACETAYDVPESALAPGRVLRCARCRSEWAPVPAEQLAEPITEEPSRIAPAPAAASPDAMQTLFGRAPDPVAAARPAGPRVSVIAGWIFSFLLLGALGCAAIWWRQSIERVWPPSSRAYALLGYK